MGTRTLTLVGPSWPPPSSESTCTRRYLGRSFPAEVGPKADDLTADGSSMAERSRSASSALIFPSESICRIWRRCSFIVSTPIPRKCEKTFRRCDVQPRIGYRSGPSRSARRLPSRAVGSRGTPDRRSKRMATAKWRLAEARARSAPAESTAGRYDSPGCASSRRPRRESFQHLHLADRIFRADLSLLQALENFGLRGRGIGFGEFKAAGNAIQTRLDGWVADAEDPFHLFDRAV